MKNFCSILLVLTLALFLSGCAPTEKELIKQSSDYTEIEVVDNGCGIQLNEASDLAFDKEEKVLYIVGDKGDFYQCSVNFENNILNLDFISSSKLGHDFTSIDSEGLSINSYTNELILSTEGANASIYPLTKEGVLNGKYSLPEVLKAATFKDANNKFEALSYHDDFGILTAVEQPINNEEFTKQTVYSLDGNFWNFDTENYDQSSVTAIETTHDGNLLVLERAQSQTINFYITVKKIILNEECKNKNSCNNEVLYQALWEGGNFEGMTRIDDIYLIVNDGQGQVDAIFKAFKID